jgi:hypothetical protein
VLIAKPVKEFLSRNQTVHCRLHKVLLLDHILCLTTSHVIFLRLILIVSFHLCLGLPSVLVPLTENIGFAVTV